MPFLSLIFTFRFPLFRFTFLYLYLHLHCCLFPSPFCCLLSLLADLCLCLILTPSLSLFAYHFFFCSLFSSQSHLCLFACPYESCFICCVTRCALHVACCMTKSLQEVGLCVAGAHRECRAKSIAYFFGVIKKNAADALKSAPATTAKAEETATKS